MNNVENRYLTSDTNLRAFIEDDKKVIEGKFLLFNSPSNLIYEENPYNEKFTEVIEKRATENTDFSRAYLTYNHSQNDVFATARSKSLTTNQADDGIYFRAILNNTQKANDMYEMAQRGDLVGLSFRMDDVEFSYSRGSDGKLLRTISSIRAIREISLIGGLYEPVYPETKVWARGLVDFIEEEKINAEEVAKKEAIKENEEKSQREKFLYLKTKIYK